VPTQLVNFAVPGAVTVVPVDAWGRPINRHQLQRIDQQRLAFMKSTLDPLTLTPLRNAVVHSAWGRGKIDLPPGIAKKLYDTRVFVGNDVRESKFRKDNARWMRVEPVSDQARNQKFKVRDERQQAQQVNKDNKDAEKQARQLEQQQRKDTRDQEKAARAETRDQEKAQRKAQKQPQGERVAKPAKPEAKPHPAGPPKEKKQKPPAAQPGNQGHQGKGGEGKGGGGQRRRRSQISAQGNALGSVVTLSLEL
jgi:hypothetical protein